MNYRHPANFNVGNGCSVSINQIDGEPTISYKLANGESKDISLVDLIKRLEEIEKIYADIVLIRGE